MEIYNNESNTTENQNIDAVNKETSSSANSNIELLSTKSAAELIGLTPDLFRHYAKSYESILPPIVYENAGYSTRSGNMKFTHEHVDLIDKIYSLTQEGRSKKDIMSIMTQGIRSEDGQFLMHRSAFQQYLGDEAVQQLIKNSIQIGRDEVIKEVNSVLQERDETLKTLITQFQATLDLIQQGSQSASLRLEDMSQSLTEKNKENEELNNIIDELKEQIESNEKTNSELSLKAETLVAGIQEKDSRIKELEEQLAIERAEKEKALEKKGFFARLFK